MFSFFYDVASTYDAASTYYIASTYDIASTFNKELTMLQVVMLNCKLNSTNGGTFSNSAEKII